MKTKLAVWLTQKKLAEDVPQALSFIDTIRSNECPSEILEHIKKDLDMRIALGDPITEEKVLSFLQEKLKTAEKLIVYWEDHPKDTNAIFFLRRYREYMESTQ